MEISARSRIWISFNVYLNLTSLMVKLSSFQSLHNLDRAIPPFERRIFTQTSQIFDLADVWYAACCVRLLFRDKSRENKTVVPNKCVFVGCKAAHKPIKCKTCITKVQSKQIALFVVIDSSTFLSSCQRNSFSEHCSFHRRFPQML